METEMEITAALMILEISPLPPLKKTTKKITSDLLPPNKTIELSINRCNFDLICFDS
jgi:hypothetical protein